MFDVGFGMKVDRFKIGKNSEYRKLRKSPGVTQYTGQIARRVAAAAGPGFEARPASSKNRARFYVTPTTPAAFQANRNHALLMALSRRY